MKRLLLVEDEPGLVSTLTDRLVREGYRVEHVGDGDAALSTLAAGRFDLVILDVGLPRKNGFDVLSTLRARGDDTPVMMLTARGQLTDRVSGLRMGADDYLAKPFEMSELLARVDARLRRDAAARPATAHNADEVVVGDVRIDLARSEVWRGSERVDVSAREFQLRATSSRTRACRCRASNCSPTCGGTSRAPRRGRLTCTSRGSARRSSPRRSARSSW